ncbi:MAG: hypothetical protein M4D80_11925 [Myxococcota bacterium]|nr:hypothetical protein [Deltaproteobacteria bacterium]MDQ3335867.1 hypothetical protein [Myxococcota bacterium]
MAPLVALVGETQQLVGPITIVEHAGKTLGVTSAELLRPHHGSQLRVLTQLDGSTFVDVAGIGLGRYAGLGLLELSGPVGSDAEVKPLSIDHVCATNDTRGAPAGIVSIIPIGDTYERLLIAVHVDSDDGGGMSDSIVRLASPLEAAHVDLEVEGCPLFAWFAPVPALRRKGEVLAVAIAYPYRARTAKPRDLPVLAELVALDDLGRALISTHDHNAGPQVTQIAGEIVEKLDGEPDPLAGLDD